MRQPRKPGAPVPEACRLLALVALALFGAAVFYWLGRPAGSVLFLNYLPPPPLLIDNVVWRFLANHVPDLVHPFVFILLTVAVVSPTVNLGAICLFWLTVDCLMEIGQLPQIATEIASSLPDWFGHVPVLDHVGWYFLSGTFDPLDVLATALGCLGAYLTVSSATPGLLQKAL